MPLLYYWRGDVYRADLDAGVGFHLNQATPRLHAIDVGDSLWAFSRRADGAYVLVAELVVHARTLNPDGFHYGRYRLWGHLARSRYFAADAQADITPLIRGLSVSSRGGVLGRAFQGAAAVRSLTLADHAVLARYAAALPTEPRARLLPEEQLEAALVEDGTAAFERILLETPAGVGEARRGQLRGFAQRRDRHLVLALRELYRGRCQVCAWDPPTGYGVELCEAHHLRWLSRGGADAATNLVLLCPNHHRAVHRCDAPFDWADRAFVFGERREPLVVDEHLLDAS